MSRNIKRIIVHHTATPRNTTLESIKRHHVAERGFDDIGYHYLVEVYGQVRLGRPVSVVGAHCYRYNWTSIGVALIGNYDRKDSLSEQATDGLSRLLADLKRQYPKAKVLGHRELAKTLCPGYDLMDWLNNWRRWAKQRRL